MEANAINDHVVAHLFSFEFSLREEPIRSYQLSN